MDFKGQSLYTESPNTGDCYRQAYADSWKDYISRLNVQGAANRRTHMPLADFGDKIEEYRQEYLAMLGIKDMDISAPTSHECIPVAQDAMCRIYRYVFHMPEGIPFYGLLFVPNEVTEPAPLLISQHGRSGTPELSADMIGENNYKNMVRRAVARGAVVFAPQLLLWRYLDDTSPTHRQHPIPYARVSLDVSLKRFGLTITGLEITFIRRVISFFAASDMVDARKIGMVGHSYGGYFTLHTMAADTRIKAGFASSFFNNMDHYTGFHDWCYKDSANLFQDAEVAALCAPRPLFVSVGKTDEIFNYQYALPEAERAREYYAALGKETNFCFFLWDGGHSIPPTDEGFDFLFDALEE